MSQPSPKTAIEKAHKLLMNLQVVAIEKDDDYTAEFLQFWAVYPKKVGKGDAYRKWQGIVKSEKKKEQVIKSVQDHKDTERWKEEEGKYIPNPATFLHQKRFDDEVISKKQKEEVKELPAIPRCKHGYPTYVACPQCLIEKS
jgi:hypothetical protein